MTKILLGFAITITLGFSLFNTCNTNTTAQLFSKAVIQKIKTDKYDQPGKAAQWLQDLRQTPNKNFSPAQLNKSLKTSIDAKELLKAENKSSVELNIPKFKFENLGPSNFGGRIRGFVIKSDNSDILLAGAVSGGVFKSEDAGQSWSPKSDFLPTLAIGSMIGDPDNANRVFAGTGEGFFNGDAARGAGIFVSEDFGETWNHLTSTNNNDFGYVNRIVRVPNSNVLVAATRTGIFRSENLGQNWNEVSNHNTNGRGFVDLKIDPSNNNHILASHFGFSNSILNLNITSPSNIAGNYLAVPASFGPDFPSSGTGDKILLLVNDGTSPSNDGCTTLLNDLTGKIALIQRGTCPFVDKVKNAQDSGAIAVIVYQNNNEGPFSMGGESEEVTIPSAMISLGDGEHISTETGLINANIIEDISEVLGRFIMQSTNAGSSWEVIDSDAGLPESDVGRMEISFGTDGVTYIAVSNNDSSTRGLWRSPGFGNNFIKTTSDTSFVERQGWYDLALAVHPTNSNTVFMGAVDQYVTRNGGSTISKNSYWAPNSINNEIKQYIHADQHGYFFSPSNPNHMYVVADGGVYKTENNGNTYIDKNNGLSISQPYGIAISPNGQRITSGTQDNGSQIFFGDTNTWIEWHGGDGGYSAWDQQNGQYLYGSTPRGGIFGSNDGGQTTKQMELPDTDGASFIQPFDIDPNNGNRLIIGTDNVFYTSNARNLEVATFTDITPDISGGAISALTFNQMISTQVLVASSSGRLYKVDGVGTSNTLVEISPNADDGLNSNRGRVTDIKVDPNDTSGNTIYITRANYDTDRILKSTDGGDSWVSLSGDLPNMPLFQVSIDPIDANRIFVGSELGLWVTNLNSNNTNWTRYHYGISYNRVMDLVWSEDDTLYVATHGRGTYKASRSAIDLSINKFITTDSNNDNDGILDANERGLLLMNITNNSGFDIDNAAFSVANNDIIPVNVSPINIASIPAMSSIVVPVPVSASDKLECLKTIDINASLNYQNVNTDTSLELIILANQEKSNQDFTDGAENSSSLLTNTLMLGNSAWRQVNNAANTGTKSWFVTNESNYADKSLVSPWLVMDGGGNILDFALKYSTELNWDGVLLEIREKGKLWTDIGNLSSVSYDTQLQTNNTAQARFAWTGSHNSWRNSTLNLGETYKGKTIQFRFRMVSDTNIGDAGFWVDDIKISNVIWKQQATCDETVSTGGKIPSSGLWFDPSRSGHGFVIEPIGRDNLYFTVFYTYNDNGNPEWYTSLTTLKNGVLNLDFAPDTLLRSLYDYSIDPSISQAHSADPEITDARLSIDFNSTSTINHSACQDETNRSNASVALARWKINNQEGEWCIQPIVGIQNLGFPDIGGTWFGGNNDSGWGLSLALAKSQLVSIIYYFDGDGQPRWSIGQQDGFKIGESLNLQMSEITGFGRLQTPVTTTSNNAGDLTISIQNTLNNLEIDGSATLNIQYQGTEGGDWNRDNTPIQILTNSH